MNRTRRKAMKTEFLKRLGVGKMPHDVEMRFMKEHKKEWNLFKKLWKRIDI